MQTILLASVWHYFFGFVLFLISIFLIGLILLQRGRGGGLTGALGGAGGQSAFGSKTGDVFTKVTIIAAGIWIITCLAADKVLVTSTGSVFGKADGGTTVGSPKKEKSSDKGANDLGQPDDSDADSKGDGAMPESSSLDDDAKGSTPEAEGTPGTDATPAKSDEKPDAASTPDESPEKQPEKKPEKKQE